MLDVGVTVVLDVISRRLARTAAGGCRIPRRALRCCGSHHQYLRGGLCEATGATRFVPSLSPKKKGNLMPSKVNVRSKWCHR
jgi:hypothetical protein